MASRTQRPSLAEALDSFRERGGEEALRVIMEFCGVTRDTAQRWSSRRLPKGLTLNKLWYLLKYHGLGTKEVERLDPVVMYLGELIAFDVITPAKALQLLNLNSAQQQYLYRVLQGELLPYSVRKEQIHVGNLIREYESELKVAIQSARDSELLPPLEEESTMVPVPLPVLPPVEVPSHAQARSDVCVPMAACFIAALGPLLDHINDSGEDAVAALRAAVGDEVFYRTLDGLKAMSTRRAREFYARAAGSDQ